MFIYNLKTKGYKAIASPFPNDFPYLRLNNTSFKFSWLPSEKLVFVSCKIGFYFIDLDNVNKKPVFFSSKFIGGQYKHFHCGKILYNTESKRNYLLGLRDHDNDNLGGTDRNSLCIWDIWDPTEMINIPIPKLNTSFANFNDNYCEMYVQNCFANAIFLRSAYGKIIYFRRVKNLNLDWGGAMFPARFKIIDINKRHVESESEFDQIDIQKQKESIELAKNGKMDSIDEINVLLDVSENFEDINIVMIQGFATMIQINCKFVYFRATIVKFDKFTLNSNIATTTATDRTINNKELHRESTRYDSNNSTTDTSGPRRQNILF